MQQLQLFEANSFTHKHMQSGSVSAIFREIKRSVYEVTLQVSSNKFLINIHEMAGKIEEFEIVTIKSFMELTKKTILLIKCLVEHLFLRLDNN